MKGSSVVEIRGSSWHRNRRNKSARTEQEPKSFDELNHYGRVAKESLERGECQEENVE